MVLAQILPFLPTLIEKQYILYFTHIYLTIPGLGRSLGGKIGSLLQYSFLGNPMDRGTWQAPDHRVTRSWTWLKQLSTAQYMTKEAGIYNGGETVSSINVAGKTGQLHVKVSNWTTYTMHKNKFKMNQTFKYKNWNFYKTQRRKYNQYILWHK